MRGLRKWKRHPWACFWMQFSGPRAFGRVATWIAALFAPPYKARRYLAHLTKNAYIAPSARIHHSQLRLGEHVFIGDRVTVYQAEAGGGVDIGNGACVHQDGIIETGHGGSVAIGEQTHIQPRCQVSAYAGSVRIGREVQVGPGCAFYPYNHGVAEGVSIKEQPLKTKGGILVQDGAWLGVGVIVLDGVSIGEGAVIGAGAVVSRNIPPGAIAAGVPAKVIGVRPGAGGSHPSELAEPDPRSALGDHRADSIYSNNAPPMQG
jgi:acetyltransferase-like isoleucine patch superfamily enzyme